MIILNFKTNKPFLLAITVHYPRNNGRPFDGDKDYFILIYMKERENLNYLFETFGSYERSSNKR